MDIPIQHVFRVTREIRKTGCFWVFSTPQVIHPPDKQSFQNGNSSDCSGEDTTLGGRTQRQSYCLVM